MKNKKHILYLVVLLVPFIFSYFAFYHYSNSHEFGISYNLFTGEIKNDEHTGHHFTRPWVLVTKIDTRPRRVCIASASRNLNCRLVQFEPSLYMELIKREGFRYYWWYNRISFNWDQETYRGVDNLLLGHSFGANRCQCVTILEEVGDESQ